MSYLVLCPTCGGKMSVNARVCPHCGDHGFIQPEIKPVPEPCRYNDLVNYDLGCEGKGFLCRTQIWGGYGLRSLQELRKLGITDMSKCVCIQPGLYLTTNDPALREKVARAVAQNDLYLRWIGYGSHSLYIHKVRCPQCKGTGKVMVDRPTGNYIDIRQRA